MDPRDIKFFGENVLIHLKLFDPIFLEVFQSANQRGLNTHIADGVQILCKLN